MRRLSRAVQSGREPNQTSNTDVLDAFRVVRQRALALFERALYPLPVKLNGDASGSARSLTGKTVYAVIEQYFRDVSSWK